ncbi:MAG: GAF domain-containing protein, partial [Zoogloeaceae bacterium]|nr:GAF domain-containing protein [Zoogloeaceae bacterium]
VSFYGGNTACIEVNTQAGERLFFDAGTGLIAAGEQLPEAGECHLFITHGHIDHIAGLWFFKPLHKEHWTTHLYFPECFSHLLDSFFNSNVFPVLFNNLAGRVIRHTLSAGDTCTLGSETAPIRIETRAVSHPGGGLAYRVKADGVLLAYSGDHEISSAVESSALAKSIIENADIAIVDATYNRQDYRPGWGHSCWEDWLDIAQAANVRQLVLTHHDINRKDVELDALARQMEESPGSLRVHVAQENLRITPQGTIPAHALESDWIFNFMDELTRYHDKMTILDRILTKAREITSTDAGTIFLVEGDELVFAYTHNDSLFSTSAAYKFAYDAVRLPISPDSIAGYVACSGETLLLNDIHHLPPGAPYRFNDSFDQRTGYQTHSMLALPFFDPEGRVSGVMQLINSLDPYTKTPCPFSAQMVYNARLLAREAGNIITQSLLQRQNVYNILRMAAVHDPYETGPHVERVGAITAELYQCWAEQRNVATDALRYHKDCIRMAAMLHDIGKVGISDAILKKPGRLDLEELSIMRSHTALGASILDDDQSEISLLARDIALHHHL